MKSQNLEVQELGLNETKKIGGGNYLKDIQDGIRAIRRIAEFFSGRPQT
ncbi:hypothetical protein [Zobellia barbeyronii]|uniref:Uncharacterized protein n=1 Tax=Zobellia barbeyronii TaxID=2748009 RepID=A0ABS5WC44_9FLAO|nr:hypothetical protein [Zobellia barbeyronii]MBT2160511.1 hypothetical protein [Zobellia barbeyronii]